MWEVDCLWITVKHTPLFIYDRQPPMIILNCRSPCCITEDFEVKLTLDMLTVRGQQHSVSTHEWMFLWKCQSFWDRKCLEIWGTRTPNFGFMPNALTIWAIRAKHLLSHIFEYWLWRYRYIWSKVKTWNVNCARASAFIFDTRTDALVKVSKETNWPPFRRWHFKTHFLERKC